MNCGFVPLSAPSVTRCWGALLAESYRKRSLVVGVAAMKRIRNPADGVAVADARAEIAGELEGLGLAFSGVAQPARTRSSAGMSAGRNGMRGVKLRDCIALHNQ
jgi:hypothetical protein